MLLLFHFFYGVGVSFPYSIVGGCSYTLVDKYNNNIASGSAVVLDYLYRTRLEYEGLLNGLKEAFVKNFRRILIRGCSELVISHYQHGQLQFEIEVLHARQNCSFQFCYESLYHIVRDIDKAIRRILSQLIYYEFELVPEQHIKFSHRLAKNAVTEWHRQREIRQLQSTIV